MSITQYSQTFINNSVDEYESICQWFEDNGFRLIPFVNGRFELYTNEILHRIEKNGNYDSYYKEDVGGSLLVFEIRIFNGKIDCICYSPILLFGISKKKLSFKKKVNWFAKYRQHGYQYLEELKIFINSLS